VDRNIRIFFAMLLVSWGMFLGLQSGLPTDETEHCHVAWLIGHEHQKPIRDFFQHHQPPIWDVLQLYFRLGGDGPEVLYFGRAVVLICTGLSVLAFFLLPGRLARRDNLEPSRFPWMIGAISLFPLILFSLIFWKTLVIRPEILSMPLFLYAVLLWLPDRPSSTQNRLVVRTFLAGVLVGAAIYTSPRFVFLSPAFFLLPASRTRLFEVDIRRIVILGGGALAFVVLYSVLRAHPLSEIFLNLEFAYVLRPVGEGYFESATPLLAVMLLFSLLMVFLCGFLTDHGKKRLFCQSIFGLCLLGMVLLADWPYMHEHHFLLLALWWGVMTATAGVESQPERGPPIRSLVPIGAVGGILLCLVSLAFDVMATETIIDRVQLKRAILARINKTDRVLCGAAFHPISALDASYYNNPIGDCPGRLATAVRLAQARRSLPDCDYIADIRAKRPALVDLALRYCVADAETHTFMDLLNGYDQISIKATPRGSLVCIMYILKSGDHVPRHASQSVSNSGVAIMNPLPDRQRPLHSISERIGLSLDRDH
jgi:hypothetical protein